MNHASLFSGLGGFDLAATWCGWHNLFSCEIDPFCRKILAHYWPDATHYTDICTTDFRPWHGRIDVLTGGFPCQPFSTAGKRKGTEDDRYLWPQMLRAIREVAPRYVVGENVPGLLSQQDGMVFRGVCADLEAEGYQVAVLNIPAAGIGAPHQRERLWFVAYASGARPQRSQQRKTSSAATWSPRPTAKRFADEHWIEAATRLCRVDYGVPRGLDTSALPKGWKAKSLKGYGNAIVPMVACQIFQTLEKTHQHLTP